MENLSPASIFDTIILQTTTKGETLWMPVTDELIEDILCNYNEVQYVGEASHKSINLNVEQRSFYIFRDTLLYKKSQRSTDYLGALKLQWTRLLPVMVESKASDIKSFSFDIQHSLVFVNNFQFSALFLKDIEDVRKWRNALKRIVIHTGFEKEYRLEDTIAQEKYSTIKIGKKTDSLGNETKYALKIYSKRILKLDEYPIFLLKNEISVLRLLQDNSMFCNLQEVYESEHHVVLVFEYIKGGQISQLIAERRNITPEFTKQVLKQGLMLLAQLDSLGIVHRSIVPEKFMIHDRGADKEISLLLLGFNYAIADELITPETFSDYNGVPGYIAPELLDPILSISYSSRSDLYSFGLMIYYLITGVHPFFMFGSDPDQVLRLNKMSVIDFELINDKFAFLIPMLKRMLEKSPFNRPMPGDILRANLQLLSSQKCMVPYNKYTDLETDRLSEASCTLKKISIYQTSGSLSLKNPFNN